MTIYGWDMSHYDAPDIGDAVSEGISFVTHKAGGDGNDAELASWWSGIKDDAIAGRVLAGAYWVLYPGNPAGRADAFIARLDSACSGWRGVPFILQADCEKWGGDPGTVPIRAEIKAFCDRLAMVMPNLRPVVYGPKWVYGDSLTGLGYPLWASSYVAGSGGFKGLYPGDASSKWGAYSGQVPAILQYTSSATIGGQTTCDANAFRGTLADLVALLAPGWISDKEDDVTEAELIAALNKALTAYFAAKPEGADGMNESVIGKLAWKQPIPNPLRASTDPDTHVTTTPRTMAYQLFSDVATVLGRVPTAEETADTVLAALAATDLPTAATALRAVFGTRAAELGALLQS